jgi:hypothetical protein
MRQLRAAIVAFAAMNVLTGCILQGAPVPPGVRPGFRGRLGAACVISVSGDLQSGTPALRRQR